MTQTCSNLVLLGMPGVGKSTVVPILVKKTACHDVTAEILIQTAQDRTLQNIIDANASVVS